MRHAALVIGLALGGAACKDESAASSPAAAPAAPAADGEAPADRDPPPSEDDGASAQGDDGEGKTSDGKTGKSGLIGLTREVIDQARTVVSDPLGLVPDSAQFVLQMQVPAVLAHPEGAAVWQKVEDKEPGFKLAMDVMRACLGRLEVVEEIAAGFDPDDHLILIARGKGLGTDATWRCFEKEASARGDSLELDITGTPRGEGPQLRDRDKSPTESDLGYFPDDDTFVMVSREWDAEVQALMKGGGTPAIEGRLSPSAKRIDPDHTVFMVGRWEGVLTAALPAPYNRVQDMALSMNIEDEALVIDLTTDAGATTDATEIRDELRTQFEAFKGMLGAFGLPGTVGPKINFESEGDLVVLRFTLTSVELKGLREGIERSF